MLMLRLSRSRANDPAIEADSFSRQVGRREHPEIDKEFVDIQLHPSDLVQDLPTHDERRVTLARGGIASVDGFRVMILLAYTYSWVMRACWQCRCCNSAEFGVSGEPCQDLFGSNASPERRSARESGRRIYFQGGTEVEREIALPFPNTYAMYSSAHTMDRRAV